MASNILQTRLKIKRDTLANWLNSQFETGTASQYLLSGEIAIVEVAANDIRFKVGDGTHKFSDLPYASDPDIVGDYVPTTRTVNGHALSADVTVTKTDLGLGNVENKSSATIRGELTKANVTTALGYTPLESATDTKTTVSYVTSGTPTISTTGKTGTVTFGSAAAKLVDTSIGDASTSANLPTSAAVASFVEGKGYKTTDNNTTYTLTQDSTDGHKLTFTPSSGTAITITIPDNNTTYTATRGIGLNDTIFYNTGVIDVAEGSNDGCINIQKGIEGGYENVSVKVHGLGSAAYTASTAYTPAAHASSTSNPHSVTAAQVGAIATSARGVKNGVASLDANGLVPSSQLPSYVDDVLEFDKKADFPTTGETGKIYVDKLTNLTWRWGGTAYVEISPSIAIGTTSSTAFAGDKGQTAYTHAVTNKGSAFTSGLYKITTNAEGHVTAATAVQKSDITALGIPGENSTYTLAGLMGSSAKGSGTQPIYWNGSSFVNTSYTVSKSVPSTAIFANMGAATASAAGTAGYVPAPAAGKQNSFLRGDGTWVVPTNTTYTSGTGITIGTGNAINHSNSVTAKTAYGSTATTASANGGTIKVTDVKYDAQGHITGSTDRTITLSQTTYTLSGLGGIGSVTVNNGLTQSKNGTVLTLGINAISMDLLEQGAKTIIFDAGTSTTVL